MSCCYHTFQLQNPMCQKKCNCPISSKIACGRDWFSCGDQSADSVDQLTGFCMMHLIV